MDLVPLQPIGTEQEEQSYRLRVWKLKIAALFTLAIFLIATFDIIPGNPLHHLLTKKGWDRVQFVLLLPVIFYAAWIFFEKA